MITLEDKDIRNLEDIRNLLQSTTNAIDKVMMLEMELNGSYENLMNTAKAIDVAGLYRPNLIPMIQKLKEQNEILKNLQFAIENKIGISKEAKWNECIKKIAQKDEFELEGISNWRISLYEMVPNIIDIDEKAFKEEAHKLMAAGFPLAFNTDHGVGSIRKSDDGFIIELWKDVKKKEILKKSLDDVLDWIIIFYNSR